MKQKGGFLGMPVWLIIVLSVLVLGGVGVGIFIAIKPKRCSPEDQTTFVTTLESLIDELISTLDTLDSTNVDDLFEAGTLLMNAIDKYLDALATLYKDGICSIDSKNITTINAKIDELKQQHPQFAADFPTF